MIVLSLYVASLLMHVIIFDCDGIEFVWYLTGRRGHDSTGVTDRVVNQLLTQLDGVETLEG